MKLPLKRTLPYAMSKSLDIGAMNSQLKIQSCVFVLDKQGHI